MSYTSRLLVGSRALTQQRSRMMHLNAYASPATRYPFAMKLGSQFSTSAKFSSPVEMPEHLDQKEAGIYAKLAEKLNPSRLDVRDISGGCGSMYAVEIESPSFRGLTTLKMHRQVQDILAEDIKGWHGIQLKTKATPAEGS